MKWPRVFAALESRNYRLYFAGQIVSLTGTWMTQTASLWLIYHLSASPFLLGLVGFASQIPIFFLAPAAGVLADRLNRHRLLLWTQALSMLQSFTLAGLALTGTINAPLLIGLSLVQGLINGIDMPVRQALVIAFVERRQHLGNAIALNSSLFNLARLAGPAMAGYVIAISSAGVCYLVDGFSYLAVIVGLLAMRLPPAAEKRVTRHPWVEMREGFRYVFGFRPMRVLIITLAIVSAVGFSYSVLTPMVAKDIFHGDARVLGYLMSASGVGALIGAIYLGSRKTIRGLGNVVAFGGALMGAGLVSFGASHSLVFSMVSLGIVGLGGVLMMASSNTLVQALVDEDKRGRVMSIFTMSFTGTMPMGNLLAGALAGAVGPARTFGLAGAICVMVAFVFYRLLPELRAAAAPFIARLVETGSWEIQSG